MEEIKNNKDFRFLYNILKFGVEEIISDPGYKIKDIKYELERYLDIEQKIKYLNKKYRKSKINGWQFSEMYKGIGSNGIESWYDYFLLSFEDNIDYLKYLTDEIEPLTKDETDPNRIQMINLDHFNKVWSLKSKKNKEFYVKNDDLIEFVDDWVRLYEEFFITGWILNKIEVIEKNNKPLKKSILKYRLEDVGNKTLEHFLDPLDYKSLLDKLSLDVLNSDFTIKNHLETGFSLLKMTSAIGYKINNSNYLKKPFNNQAMAKVLNNTFNTSLSSQSYGGHIRSFANSSSREIDLHLDLVRNIP